MTIEERRIVLEKFNEGASVKEIADMMHYSTATIARNLPAGMLRPGRRLECVVYEGLKKWFFENNVSGAEFNRRLGRKDPYIYRVLKGEVSPSKRLIDKILAITGLTYEEAFKITEDVKGYE